MPSSRESRAHYRWPPCHPRGAGNCNPYKAYAMGFLKY